MKSTESKLDTGDNIVKKIISALTVSSLLAALSGCTITVYGEDTSNPYLFKKGELIKIETPTWRFEDSVYDVELGEFKVKNVDVSISDSEQKLTDIRVETRFSELLVPWLGDWNKRIHTYEVSKTEKYSFELHDMGNNKVGTTTCFMTNIHVEERDLTKNRSMIGGLRAASFLSCTIKHNNTNWSLSLAHSACSPAQFSLHSDEQAKKVETLSWDRKGQISAYSFSQKGVEQAALGIKGNPVIWLESELNEVEKQLLLLSSYALVLHDWLDGDWQRVASFDDCMDDSEQ